MSRKKKAKAIRKAMGFPDDNPKKSKPRKMAKTTGIAVTNKAEQERLEEERKAKEAAAAKRRKARSGKVKGRGGPTFS